MVKSESDMIYTPRTGQVITAENGTQYFVWIVDVVRHTAEKAAST